LGRMLDLDARSVERAIALELPRLGIEEHCASQAVPVRNRRQSPVDIGEAIEVLLGARPIDSSDSDSAVREVPLGPDLAFKRSDAIGLPGDSGASVIVDRDRFAVPRIADGGNATGEVVDRCFRLIAE